MANFVFFGTPSFAVPTLKAIFGFSQSHQHSLPLVVCQPDRPKGRGQALTYPPVKETAMSLGLFVAQPSTLKKNTKDGEDFEGLLHKIKPDLAIVVAYGQIIPKRILEIPKRGFVNIHASLLPRWRGAAPIQRAIEAGDQQTGICIMDMTPELDAGDVYQTTTLPILPTDTAPLLADKLSVLGAQTLLPCLPGLLAGTLPKKPQAAQGITYAYRLEKEQGRLNWNLLNTEVDCQFRAMQPWPGSFITHRGIDLKITGLRIIDISLEKQKPGEILSLLPLIIACQKGAIEITHLQAPGKKSLPAHEFIKGYHLNCGEVLKSSQSS